MHRSKMLTCLNHIIYPFLSLQLSYPSPPPTSSSRKQNQTNTHDGSNQPLSIQIPPSPKPSRPALPTRHQHHSLLQHAPKLPPSHHRRSRPHLDSRGLAAIQTPSMAIPRAPHPFNHLDLWNCVTRLRHGRREKREQHQGLQRR